MYNPVPDLLAPKPVTDAVAKVDDLTAVLAEAHQQVQSLTDEHHRTVISDQKAYGAAVLADPKADPPKRKAEAVKVRLDTAKARVDALTDALQVAQQAVEQARHDHRDEWLQALREAAQQTAQEAMDAAQTLVDKWSALHRLRSVERYVDGGLRRYKPGLPSLPLPFGNTLGPDRLLALLRENISPAPPSNVHHWEQVRETDPDGGLGATRTRMVPVDENGVEIITVPTVYPDDAA